MKNLFFLLTVISVISPTSSQKATIIRKDYREKIHDSIRCNLATIYRLGPSGKIGIHSKPATRSMEVAQLPEGNIVYVCDQDGIWANVFFSGTEAPCFRAYEGGLEQKRARMCKSGWVEQKWVNVISG
jgi:hypothetical protein